MRKFLLLLFTLWLLGFKGQDKIYFLDGRTLECRVTEITDAELIVNAAENNQRIARSEVLLVRYKNGLIESFNTAATSVIYSPSAASATEKIKNAELYKPSYISFNTLALCNADIAAFYEYLPRSKLIGLGIMGAYNFNVNSTAQNAFISLLPNARKNYDLGAIFNIYPGRLKKRTTFYFGMMIKYTSFGFNYTLDTASAGGIVKYKPAVANQLATIFTAGTTTFFGEHFFLKTLFGLGSFRLHGEYQKQFNYEVNKTAANPHNFSSLPKLYFGLNVGYNF